MTKQKISYTLEIENCDQILFSGKISKSAYEMELKRLFNQVKETENDETKTEYLGEESYKSPMRKVTFTTFLRGTTYIDFEKTEWL